jgi:class 3 adenylate cyclase
VWLYFGVVAGLFVYNLFICITLRSVTYLLYLLYILHISAFFFWGSNGLGFEYFSLSVETHFRLIMYLGIVSMVFVSLLTMRFLELWEALRVWFIVLAVPTLLLFFVALGAWFLPIALVQDIGNPATGAMATLCAVVAVRALGLNFLPARYFAAGWVLFLVATVLFVLQNAGVLESSVIAQYGAQAGSAVEMVMFSMALASRISVLEKERNEATAKLLHTSQELILSLQESERTLEKKVRERTQNLQDANGLLSEQAHKIQIVNSTLQEQNLALEESRAHIERLMLNILPKSITARLQAGEKGIADKHESVTVLFADIVDFTKLSSNISPEELVALLDTLFSRFDELVEQHQLEKIKTIGDAYMVVGGLKALEVNHTTTVAQLALDMQAAAKEMATLFDLPQLVLRIGMHSGAVVAGVIGKKKLAYDLWGDTVNTASRMESHSEAGKIHVSEEVYDALKGTFTFEERGEIEVKGKGMMRTWFLVGSSF